MMNFQSDAFVFFGATGDLAYKQIFPALEALIRRDGFQLPIIGVAKSGWNLDQLKARAEDSLKHHGRFDQSTFSRLCSHLNYIDGDYRDPATFAKLRQALGNAQRPIYYLAIPPTLFATVAEGLDQANCVSEARVVVEKPFGRDLASARDLNQTLHRFFPEQSIYRIDHYLGKEPVQNLIYFRFANPQIEASWNREHIDSVQITMAESFGVKGRGKFYEEAGAIRDVVQNHMLEVLACLSMECPPGTKNSDRRLERGKLLRAIQPLDPASVVLGQFRGYRNEPGVAADSRVETFAAVRLEIDNDRWRGVPFYIRAGKCLPVTVTEVFVRFKPTNRPVLDDQNAPSANYYRFRLTPEMCIALGVQIKRPGEGLSGESSELMASVHPPDQMTPYERLLGDAVNGDPALFADEVSVEEAWRIVDPVLGRVCPLQDYEPGSWGPPALNQSLQPSGGWHNPVADVSPLRQ